MLDRSRTPVMLDVLNEHFEELDFLWEQRESVIFAPDWNLLELAELEERAEAHLDGLRIGAGHSVEIARPALAAEERGATIAAALTLMAMDPPDQEAEVVLAMAEAASPMARNGIRIGLRHSDVSRVADRLTQMASMGEAAVRAAAVDVLAFHGLPAPPRLAELMSAPDAEIRRRCYRAAARFGGPWSQDMLEDALACDDPGLRRTGLETSAHLGIPRLAAICRQAASGRPPVPEAVSFLGVLGDPQDLPLLESLAGQTGVAWAAIAAIQGLGALGHPRAIPTLLKAMADPKLTRAAGAAFIRITAAQRIEADELLPPPPDLPDHELEFWDDTKPPDPERARIWWEREKRRFAPERRWQAGLDISRGLLDNTFNHLPLAARRDVYLGARARDPQKTQGLELEKRAALQLGWR